MASISSIRHTPKATYEDFVHSMSDRPQYFVFFLDKACRIAMNIGVKSADKEEFAIVAIEHLWSNIDKYDPSRAEFSAYFNTCIGHKIYDLIRSSNSDKVFGLNRANRASIENKDESILDDGDDKTLKKLEFADRLIEEFKSFIDALPREKKEILCASEFGKLAMGETPSDRNYAETIAAKTGRTAATIRKIAERTKKEAIRHVQEKGLDYGAYSRQIEFITTEPNEDEMDLSALDWSLLSGVQRLKLRMYLYEKSVEDGIISEDACSNLEAPEEISSYEAGKRAAFESAALILRRIKKAELNLKRSREEKDLISFVYWFVLIHEYNHLIISFPMPEEIQDVFDEIDSYAPKEYLEHKRKCGYSRLPDYRTVYGRGYDFPDIIGCALSDRCTEEILAFEPKSIFPEFE